MSVALELWDDDEEDIVLTQEERDLSDELDRSIQRERVMAGVEMTPYLHHRIDKEYYDKAKRRVYHERAMKKNPEAVRESGRKNYHNHRIQRRAQQKNYYDANQEEILAQKQGYYRTNRETILAQRQENYVPHPKEVKDTKLAEHRRQKSNRSYQNCRETIAVRRKAKRQATKELWSTVEKHYFTLDRGNKTIEVYVIKQKSRIYSSTVQYRISQVINPLDTPITVNKTGVTFPFRYIFEELDLELGRIVSVRTVSMNTIRKDYPWFLEDGNNEN